MIEYCTLYLLKSILFILNPLKICYQNKHKDKMSSEKRYVDNNWSYNIHTMPVKDTFKTSFSR